MRKRQDLRTRLMKHVNVTDECWEWTGHRSRTGYGAIAMPRREGKTNIAKAHRVSYELFVGPIPDGLVIDHLCRNRACVRPDHMEPVTAGVNALRGDTVTAANSAKTHCERGHPFDDANTIRIGRTRRCRTCINATGAERQRKYRERHPLRTPVQYRNAISRIAEALRANDTNAALSLAESML